MLTRVADNAFALHDALGRRLICRPAAASGARNRWRNCRLTAVAVRRGRAVRSAAARWRAGFCTIVGSRRHCHGRRRDGFAAPCAPANARRQKRRHSSAARSASSRPSSSTAFTASPFTQRADDAVIFTRPARRFNLRAETTWFVASMKDVFTQTCVLAGRAIFAHFAGSSVLGCLSVMTSNTVTVSPLLQMADDFAVDVGLAAHVDIVLLRDSRLIGNHAAFDGAASGAAAFVGLLFLGRLLFGGLHLGRRLVGRRACRRHGAGVTSVVGRRCAGVAARALAGGGGVAWRPAPSQPVESIARQNQSKVSFS